MNVVCRGSVRPVLHHPSLVLALACLSSPTRKSLIGEVTTPLITGLATLHHSAQLLNQWKKWLWCPLLYKTTLHLRRTVWAAAWTAKHDAMASAIRFGPREAGDGEMRQGATGRRQGGDRKTTGWRQEDDRKPAGKRQESDRKRQAGDRKATGELRQEGDRRATGRRQGGDNETTGKRQETRHSDRISARKATGRRQEGNKASGDREATGKRQEKATGERQESDRRATGERQGVFLRQEGDRKATGRRQEGDRRATGLWRTTSETK